MSLFIKNTDLNPSSTYWVSSLGNIRIEDMNPQINVVLYELKEGIDEKDYNFSFKQLKSFKPIELWVDVGFLEELSMGCFIKKLKVVPPKKHSQNIEINNLGIPKRGNLPFELIRPMWDFKIESILVNKKSKGPKNAQGYYVPSYNFPFSKHHRMPCIYSIHEPNKSITLFPCIEVIRFYYIDSKELANLIFLDGLNQDKIFRQEKTTKYSKAKIDGSDFVQLSKYVSRSSLNIIGRMALYEGAYRSAKFIFPSIRNDIANGIKNENDHSKYGYPRAFFPFNDESILNVNAIDCGQIIDKKSDFEGYHVKLITRINSCNRSFLESGFIFNTDNNNTKADKSDAKERKGTGSNPGRPQDNLYVNNDQKPNPSKFFPNTYFANSSNVRFPNGPREEHLILQEKEFQKTVNVGGPPPSKDYTDSSSFQSGSDSNSNATQASNGQKKPNKNKNKPKYGYENGIAYMKKLESHFRLDKRFKASVNWHTMYFNPNGIFLELGDMNSFNFAKGSKQRVKDDMGKEKWAWMGEREVVVLEIIPSKNPALCFYIVDVLPRKNSSDTANNLLFLHLDSFEKISSNYFHSMFLLFSKRHLIKLEHDDFRDLKRLSWKHGFYKNPESTFKKAKKYISNCLK